MTRKNEINITAAHRAMFAEMLRDGTDPISFFCGVLRDESAPVEARKEAARELKPYYHRRLDGIGPLLERFSK
jgi:hypothetical protein